MSSISCVNSPVESHPREAEPASLIRVGECGRRTEWEAYVDRRGGLFHRWDWSSVFDVYRLPLLRLAAYRGDRIVGILPLVQQRSRLFGTQWVSLPWFDAAGIVADEASASAALVREASSVAGARAGDTLQFRQSSEERFSPHCRTDKVLMRLRLPGSAEQLWDGLKAKVRNQVRKAEKEGLDVRDGGPELLPEFFDVYSRNMRDLGSPSHSLAFFAAICAAFAGDVTIWSVRHSGRAIGAGFTMRNGPVLEIPWASSLREFGSLCVNHAMYWKILEAACGAGFEWFHFGRSTVDSGTYHFKRQWGAEAAPLYWYYLGDERAAAGVSDPGERFSLARRAWTRLPLCVSRRLGPRLISKLA